ncbi:hypothetical protein ACI799_06530 [Blastococcus sp. SYSU DS0753]
MYSDGPEQADTPEAWEALARLVVAGTSPSSSSQIYSPGASTGRVP